MQISSGTVSLFASVALAVFGAIGLAYTLKHPGTFSHLAQALLAKKANGPAVKVSDQAETQAAIESATGEAGTVTLSAGEQGHFETEAEINGRRVDVMVDTGATLVALTNEDAENAGIFLRPSDFTHSVATANGTARVAPVTIERISIGDITVRNVQGAVSEPGKLHRTLLGMSFLSRLSRVDMRDGALFLQE